jgi:hypothetical protein
MAFHSDSLHHELRLPKVEMNKFDGSDATIRATQMEHYFSLHGIIDDLTKLHISFLYLDPECTQWCKNSHRDYIACTQFVADLYECLNIETHHLVHLTKLKQSSTMKEYIVSFEKLYFRMDDMSDTFFWECFISGLKDDI